MNLTSRQSKFKTKLSNKIIHKSSLPNIDPIHSLQTKYQQNFIPSTNITISKQNDKNPSLYKKQPTQLKHHQDTIIIIQSEPREYQNIYQTILQKNKTAQLQTQLTMDTILNNQHQNKQPLTINKETSSKGFDMWNLNRNLKQFSQTRKLGFFNNKQNHANHNTMQSPYSTLNKTKTQQIRSINKFSVPVSTNSQRQRSQPQIKVKKFTDPIRKISQKQTKSFSTIQKKQKLFPLQTSLYGTISVKKNITNLYSTIKNHHQQGGKNFSQPKFPSSSNNIDSSSSNVINPYLRTFINGSHLKRQPSNRNLQILQMNSFYANNKDKEENYMLKINDKKKQKIHNINNIRKNRFQKVQNEEQQMSKVQQEVDIDRTFQEEYSKSLDYKPHLSPQKNIVQQVEEEKIQQIQENEYRSSSSPTKIKADFNKKTQQKKKFYQYNKSIQKINKALLRSADNYLEFYNFSTMPTSKIQFYIDSLNHPEFTNQGTEYKSSFHGNQLTAYDFSFVEPCQVRQNTKGKRQAGNSKNKGKNMTTRN